MPTLLVDSYNSGENYTYSDINSSKIRGQTFTASKDYNIYSAKAYIYRIGLPGNITFELKAADTNYLPTGAVLGTCTINGNNLLEVFRWVEFIFTLSQPLVSGNKYAIYPIPTNGSNCLGWRCRYPNGAYGGGKGLISTDGGVNWTAVSNTDYYFETYEYIEPQPPPAPATITYPATDANGEFEVSWDASEGADSYILEQSIDAGANWTEIYSGTGTSYFRNIANGDYLYRVKAHNEEGDSAYTTGETCTVDYTPATIVQSENLAIKVSACSGGV